MSGPTVVVVVVVVGGFVVVAMLGIGAGFRLQNSAFPKNHVQICKWISKKLYEDQAFHSP